MTDEVSQYETLRQVLEVENSIEDGCEVLLDKEQTLIRQGEGNVRLRQFFPGQSLMLGFVLLVESSLRVVHMLITA